MKRLMIARFAIFIFLFLISRDGRITTYDFFNTERRLSDSVRLALFVWNGGGSDFFIENIGFTRTLTSDLPSVDFGILGDIL